MRGVDLFSTELGMLLVDEFADVMFVKLINTLCGLSLIFCRVDRRLITLLEGLPLRSLDSEGGDCRTSTSASSRVVLELARSTLGFRDPEVEDVLLGDGERDEVIQDFRANEAKEPETDFRRSSLTDLTACGPD